MKEGWKIKKLGEVFDVRDGTHDSPKYQDVGYPLITSKNLKKEGLSFDNIKLISEEDYKKINERSVVHKGDVLFAMIGTIGNPTMVTMTPSFAIKNVALFKIPNGQSGKFLKYYLESEWVISKMFQEANGTTQKFVGLGYLRDFPINLPSLPEQQRIVAILDEAFESIAIAKANAEKNLQNAKALFESYLQLIFTEKVGGWEENKKPLSELCELIVDCEHKTAPTQSEGIPSIRTPNIGKGKLLLDGVYRVSEDTYREWTRRAEPVAGDLILAREAPAGNVAVIPSNLKVCLGQRTVLIRPKSDVLDSYFLALMLLQPQMQQKLLAHSRGATVQHVNMKDIRALNIGAIPCLSVQRNLVSMVNKLSQDGERLESLYQQKITALDELKKALLHQAFSGQL